MLCAVLFSHWGGAERLNHAIGPLLWRRTLTKEKTQRIFDCWSTELLLCQKDLLAFQLYSVISQDSAIVSWPSCRPATCDLRDLSGSLLLTATAYL